MIDIDPDRPLQRGAFLRIAGATAFSGASLVIAGCRNVGEPAAEGAGSGEAAAGEPSASIEVEPLVRPVLRPWSEQIVWIDAPVEELPVAYVSMAHRQVYVDRSYRDRASWLLDAHISVSTWHWRIPLPGDPPGQPISPGDTRREFEELEMDAWDPSSPPAMDDIRIVRGTRARRRIDFSCIEELGVGGGAWCSGGPWDVVVAAGAHGTVREDFMVLGGGTRFTERGCSGASEAVQFATWGERAR
jgi:hypothetical protein